jgi:hypothetical protein
MDTRRDPAQQDPRRQPGTALWLLIMIAMNRLIFAAALAGAYKESR